MNTGFVEKELPGRLAAIEWVGSGVKARNALASSGRGLFAEAWNRLDASQHQEKLTFAEQLRVDGVSVVTLLDDCYPQSLLDLNSPPPFLFVRGKVELLRSPGIGMCGSRASSERGLVASKNCAERAARLGYSVVSGYARGVDMAAHAAALKAGGATVIVLAEGITNFRVKRELRHVFDWEKVLVVSQFAPNSRWSPGNAMSRNGVIAGLGQALVVVEAGATGGTINAGRQGLALGRKVIALDYSGATPSGSQVLMNEGATTARTPGEFEELISSGRWLEPPTDAQESFF